MHSKFIAIAAISAQAQIIPGDDGRIFSTNLDGVDIDTILGEAGADYAVSGDDYFETINNAIGAAFEAPDYVYEEVGPMDGSLPEYVFYGDYDGTQADQAQETAPSAGRPNDSESDDATRDLNTGINKPDGHDTVNGFNHCRVCTGQTASDCQSADTWETCNDAQDACQVTIRSQKVRESGSWTTVAKFYSGCKQLAACQAEFEGNFYVEPGQMAVHDQCKADTLPARFYRVSECTFCKKMASMEDSVEGANSRLFGNDVVNLYVDGDTSYTFAALLSTPRAVLATDIYAENDFY